MKSRLLASVLALALLPCARAADAADLARAQIVFAKVMNSLQQFQKVAGATGAATPAPIAPAPLPGKTGKYFAPYDSNGQLTEWASKALSANIGAAIGSKAGEKAGTMAASKIPLAGGFLAMGAKKKGKELGAMAAVGGADFVKKSSDASFNSVQDLAVHMHLNHAGKADYIKAFAAAMAIYPDFEKTYEQAIKQAYGAR
ncbi:MAG: hypothetical protein JNG82_06840 [Opitutaceae bacterium]|jgi:hypothetical protein|nr:hypothetical protein [Opitutaceae bacterium]